METDFINTENDSFRINIEKSLEKCDELFFSVAFARKSGLNQIKDGFDRLMQRGGAARFCFDVTQGMTDPDVIEELATYPGESSVRMLFGNGRKMGFGHSKIYQFSFSNDKATSLVGSSNLSIGGFKNNSESSLSVTDGIRDGVNRKIREYLDTQWNSPHSIDLFSNTEVFLEYRKLYEARNPHSNYDEKFQKDLKILATTISSQDTVPNIKNVDWYYFLGLLVANAKYQTRDSLNKKILNFKFLGGVLNSTNAYKGFIANEVNGNLLGSIKLPQDDTNRKHIKRIAEKVFAWLKQIDPNAKYEEDIRRNKTLSYEFSITLPSTTDFSTKLFSILSQELRTSENKMKQFMPQSINKVSPQDLLKFVQGYSDFRGRLSSSDRVGKVGPLRIALGVNTKEREFLNEFSELMISKLGYNINIADGTNRSRDHMLRITATKETVDIFAMGWRRRMADAFAIFNDQYPSI